MTSPATFACCRFSAATSLLALPVERVAWVHDNDRSAPHIGEILNIEVEDQERRILEIQDNDGSSLFLSVDLPIGVEDFEVQSVLPQSALLTDEFTEAVVECNGELVLLLDGHKISEALRARIKDRETETDE